MSESKPVRLDSGQNTNWHTDAAPVAILNDASTLHDRIAYLWGLTNQLADFADILAGHEIADVNRVATMLQWHIQPMIGLLERMAEESQPGGA